MPSASSPTTTGAAPPRSPRCPLALQEIFLASNAGNEVHTPPPSNIASKTFQRADWNFHAKQQQQQAQGQQQRGGKRSLLSLFSRATTSPTPSPPPSPASLLGVSKGRVNSLSQRIIPLVQQPQHDPLLATVLPKYSDEVKQIMSPQEFLNALLLESNSTRAKYYSTQTYSVKDSAYYNKPTTFQLQSYGSHLTNMVRQSNADAVRDMLVSCNNNSKGQEEQLGLSPNACNVYGESIVTMICRRGDLKLLQVLMDTGCCSLQVSDDCGRTPLHDACWSSGQMQPCFGVIDIILKADARLLYMKDARGSLPLDYVPKQHWDAWKRFLVKAVDVYFPVVNDDDNDCIQPQGPPELTKCPPNSRPLSTPPNSLPNALAAMVAFGKLTPDEARMMAAPDSESDDDDSEKGDADGDDVATVDSSSNYDDEDDWSTSSSCSSCSSSDNSEDYDSAEDFDSSEDEEEEASEDEEDDDDSSESAMKNQADDMDDNFVMTGSLLTGKLK